MEAANNVAGENAMQAEQAAAAPYVTYDAKVKVKVVGTWIKGATERGELRESGSFNNAVLAAKQAQLAGKELGPGKELVI